MLQVQRLQLDYERLQQAATEQINAALRDGMAAAESAKAEAQQGESSALQDALDREARLTTTIVGLQAEYEVGLQKSFLLLWTKQLCAITCH